MRFRQRRHAELRPQRPARPAGPGHEARDDQRLGRVARDKVQGVDAAGLAEPIDAPDALLEPGRRPGQLEVDHPAAPRLEVQALARRVGRDQHAGLAGVEARERTRALLARQRAVQTCHGRDPGDRFRHALEGVAVLREHDRRLARAADQPDDGRDLALVGGGGRRRVRQRPEPPPLARAVGEPRRGEHRVRRVVGVVSLAVGVEREPELPGVGRGLLVEQAPSPRDRGRQRSRARQCPLPEHDHGQPRAGSPVGFAPHRARVALEQPVHPALGLGRRDGQQLHAARAGHARLRARAAEHQHAVVARVRQAPEPAERLVARVGPGVRRGREERHAARPPGQAARGQPAIAPARHGVRFIDDERIPHDRLERARHFRPLDEVERDDADALELPRIRAARQPCHVARERGGVHERRVETEPMLELGDPLVAQARRRQHERATRQPARRQLRQDQARLDRLAEAHVVGQQHARREPADDGERRLELVREQIHAGAGRGVQAVEGMRRPGGAGQDTHGRARGRGAGPTGARQPPRSIERVEQRAGAGSGRTGERGQVQLFTGVVASDARDAPVAAAHPHELARHEIRVHFLHRLRRPAWRFSPVGGAGGPPFGVSRPGELEQGQGGCQGLGALSRCIACPRMDTTKRTKPTKRDHAVTHLRAVSTLRAIVVPYVGTFPA